MRYSRRIVLALTVLFAMAHFAAAQVLEQVPDGAMVVVKVKNLAETNTKLAAFFKDLGVDQLDPDLADPWAAVKKEMGVTQGLDDSGELAFVYVDPDTSHVPEQKSLLLLLPVSDYKAFIGNFADAKTDGDFTEAQIGKDPQKSFIASWGKYAAISPSKELLTKKPAGGIKLTGLTAKELVDKDMIIYGNMAEIRKQAIPELEDHRDEWIEDATAKMQGDNAKFAPVVKALITQAVNVAEGYLKDSNAATYGVSITKDGIAGTMMTEFDPGTYSGNLVSMVKNADDNLVTGLPNASYLIYGGALASPDVTKKAFDDFIAPIQKELVALGADGKPFIDYLDSARKLNAVKGGSFGMMTPSGMMGQGSIVQVAETLKGDSKAIGDAYKELADHQQEVMALFAPEMQGGGMQKTTFTPAVKTIDGVSFDQMETTYDGGANNPQAAQIQQMMKIIYGPDGAKFLTGAVDADTRVISVGITDDVISQLIGAAKSKNDPFAKDDGVKLVSDALPKKKVGVVYVAVDALASVGLKYAASFGMALPVNIPPNQPPVAASLATEGTAVRIDTFVPTKLVKSLTAAYIQFQMMMNGGGQGGGQQGGGGGGI